MYCSHHEGPGLVLQGRLQLIGTVSGWNIVIRSLCDDRSEREQALSESPWGMGC